MTEHLLFVKRRTKTVAVLVSLIFTSVLLLVPSVAQAAGGGDGCNPNRTDNYIHWYWSGVDDASGASTYGGIEADIYEYSPWVHSVSDSEYGADYTSQWVMLDNGTDWAQDGWLEYAGGVRYSWVEFNDPGVTSWDNYFPNFPINSTIYFKVTQDSACPNNVCFAFYDNGSSTPLTTSAHDWNPTDAEAESETHTAASQMPGGYDNPTETYAIEVYVPGGWQWMDGTTSTATSSGSVPSWDNVFPSPGTIGMVYYESWDSACKD